MLPDCCCQTAAADAVAGVDDGVVTGVAVVNVAVVVVNAVNVAAVVAATVGAAAAGVANPKTLNLKPQTWLERASPSRVRFLVFSPP